MIEAISVSNVRLFEGDKKWEFNLKPLSVFCGTNSSGKSTILKLPVLLAQSQRTQEELGSTLGRLRCRGAQIDLGNYESLVSNNDKQRQILIAITCQQVIYRSTVDALRSSRRKKSRTTPNPEAQDPSGKSDDRVTITVNGEFTFCHELPDIGEDQKPDKSTANRLSSPKAGYLLRAHFTMCAADGEELLDWWVEARPGSSRPLAGHPATYVLAMPSDYFKANKYPAGWRPLRSERPGYEEAIVILRGILPESMCMEYKKDNATSSSGESFYMFPLPNALNAACAQLGLTLSRLHYLGPLRSPPKRHYLTDLEIMPSMDPFGEFLGYVLRDSGEQFAWTIMPPHDAATTDSRKIERRPVLEALQPWLHYLRAGDEPSGTPPEKEVDVEKSSGVVLQFKLRTLAGAGLHALADSGFGYSQVIPVLVRCLLASPADTVLIEQPELHLHPAVQIRLARFFMEMALIGKQIIIESHSEHLVNALRVLAAEDESGRMAAACKIVFIDADSRQEPAVHDLSIQPDGMVPNWPDAFFGESLTLSTRLLKAQRRHLMEKSKGTPRGASPRQ